MKAISLCALLCALASPAIAQVSSPSGFLTTEGNGRSLLFGLLPEARFVFMDSGFRGQPLVINELAWRRDGSSGPVNARSWTQVTVTYAECDASQTHVEFSRVALSTPTQVFSGSMSWPAFAGPPANQPALWGGPQGNLRVPFAQSVVSAGVNDVSFEFAMSGGGGSSPYSLDSTDTTRLRFGPVAFFGNGSRNGCVDGGGSAPGPVAGDLNGSCITHGVDFPNPNVQNTVEFALMSNGTAESSPVAHIAGLVGSSTGMAWPGLACNKLHVDLSMPHVLSVPITSRRFARTAFRIPYQPGLVGRAVWLQAGWEDSRDLQLKLTNAVRVEIPLQPRVITRTSFFAASLSATSGGGRHHEDSFNPMFRYGM